MISILAIVVWMGMAVPPGGTCGPQRIAPSTGVKCSRDHLTAFTGRVLLYRRTTGRIVLRVRTDEETTENFTLRFPKTEDGSKYFLLKGEGFKPEDWGQIEVSRSRLRPKMRATVWVCDDGSTPIIEWRPAEL